jgi:aconitate hydratase
VVVAGTNYGQGSSREHAALAPRYLGLRMVIAKEFARIHRQNLVNFGVLPVTFDRPEDYDAIGMGDRLRADGLREAVATGQPIEIACAGRRFTVHPDLSEREREVLLAGGVTSWAAQQRT